MYRLRDEYSFLENELIRVEDELSVDFQVAKKIREAKGRPILFENVILRNGTRSSIPILANIVSTRERLASYLGVPPNMVIHYLLEIMNRRKRPSIVDNDMYMEVEPDLNKLPILQHYPRDGGPYITSSIVVAYDKEYGFNTSYHRMMQIDRNKLAIRIVPRHLHKYVERGLKRFAICIGNPVEVLVASAMSPELGVSELDIANAIKEIRLVDFDGVVGTMAEIVMIGELTGEEHDEGPFVDLTGTYDIVRKQPVVEIEKIYIRENAFYHAILPGDYEHKLLMGLSREPTILKAVRETGVDCLDVYLTPGGSSWLHCVIKIRKRSEEDGRKAIEAAFRGHSSLKLAIVVEEDIDIYDPNEVEWAIATRVQPNRDVYIYPDQIGSSLDPSADQKTRRTAKWGIDATIHNPERRGDFEKVI
jgi:UbiD family decarboxylase